MKPTRSRLQVSFPDRLRMLPNHCRLSRPLRFRSASVIVPQSHPGAGEGIRTPDPLITNQMLYRLSYASRQIIDYTESEAKLQALRKLFCNVPVIFAPPSTSSNDISKLGNPQRAQLASNVTYRHPRKCRRRPSSQRSHGHPIVSAPRTYLPKNIPTSKDLACHSVRPSRKTTSLSGCL